MKNNIKKASVKFWEDLLLSEVTLDKKKDKGDNNNNKKNRECRVVFLVHCTFG